MAKAKKCERCGKYYDLVHISASSVKHINGVAFIDLDSEQRYHTREAFDLCEECCKELVTWLNEFINILEGIKYDSDCRGN